LKVDRESQFNTAGGSECYNCDLQILFDMAIKEGFPFNFK